MLQTDCISLIHFTSNSCMLSFTNFHNRSICEEECTYFIILLKLRGYLQLKISLNHKMKYLHATKEFAILHEILLAT